MAATNASSSSRNTATFVPYFWEAYNEIVEPRRFDHYLIRRWLPDLGSTGFLLVKVLRDRCYFNPQTGALRDTCEVSMDELAQIVGVSRAFLFKQFKENVALQQFVRRIEQYQFVDGKPRREKNRYQVCMDDPVHPEDMERYDELRALRERERQEPLLKRVFKGKPGANPYESTPETHRENSADSYESTRKTHRPEGGSYESTTETADTKCLQSTSETADTSCLESTSQTAISDSLPSGRLYTSLSTPAAAPQHKCCPPEGEAEGDALDPLAALWQQALVTLSEHVNKPTFEAHLRPLRPVRQEGDTFVLAAPSAFTLEWIVKRHEEHIREALEKALGRAVTVEIVLESK